MKWYQEEDLHHGQKKDEWLRTGLGARSCTYQRYVSYCASNLRVDSVMTVYVCIQFVHLPHTLLHYFLATSSVYSVEVCKINAKPLFSMSLPQIQPNSDCYLHHPSYIIDACHFSSSSLPSLYSLPPLPDFDTHPLIYTSKIKIFSSLIHLGWVLPSMQYSLFYFFLLIYIYYIYSILPLFILRSSQVLHFESREPIPIASHKCSGFYV